nr:hypothetical protein [Cressdnaviricota sp.]
MVNAEDISSSPIGTPWWSGALNDWNDPLNPFVLPNINRFPGNGTAASPILLDTPKGSPIKPQQSEFGAINNLGRLTSKLLLNKND